jgi:hypothetical protein
MLQSTLDAEGEVARLTAAGGRGIVLRLGSFYGPGSAVSEMMLVAARRGIAPLFGPDAAFQDMLWIDDAAAAVVAALESGAPAGVSDVVDDEPLTRAELAAALASSVGRRRLWRPPSMIARALAGDAAAFLIASRRVSNRRFKEATGWRPSVPSARLGLARLAAAAPAPTGPGRWQRAGLAYLAAMSLLVGGWALVAPGSFYATFPGLGMAWVSVDGPFNEHLLRDVGALQIALGLVALLALRRPGPEIVGAAALAALAFSGPHFVYHAVHLGALATDLDRLLQTASLAVAPLIALGLLRSVARADRPAGESSVAAGAASVARSA